MKALSLYQPLAWCVAQGYKLFETRSWPTAYRGPLAIHAALKKDAPLWFKTIDAFRDRGLYSEIPPVNAPLGMIVAVVDLLEIRRVEDVRRNLLEFDEDGKPHGWEIEYDLGDYSDGRFAWILGNVRPLSQPIPVRGAQRLFNLPPKTEQHILEQHLSAPSVPSCKQS